MVGQGRRGVDVQGVGIRSECDQKVLCRIVRELPQIKGVGSRERLRVHRAPADSLSLVPSTKVRERTMACKSSSKGFDAPSGFQGHLHSYAQPTHMLTI